MYTTVWWQKPKDVCMGLHEGHVQFLMLCTWTATHSLDVRPRNAHSVLKLQAVLPVLCAVPAFSVTWLCMHYLTQMSLNASNVHQSISDSLKIHWFCALISCTFARHFIALAQHVRDRQCQYKVFVLKYSHALPERSRHDATILTTVLNLHSITTKCKHLQPSCSNILLPKAVITCQQTSSLKVGACCGQ